MKKDSLGDRMKENYENRSRHYLTRRTPVIMRLDGRAFHTLTKRYSKPFDTNLNDAMIEAAIAVFKEIQGAKIAYVQSDEISILITDFDKLTTEAWFDYNIQKMTSISAGIASATFSKVIFTPYDVLAMPLKERDSSKLIAVFDSRVFNVPKEDVTNYFIWRQQDWVRNSISMLAQAHYSHKELHKKGQADMHEMLHKKDVNWAKIQPRWKNGTLIYSKEGKNNRTELVVDHTILIQKHRDTIERYLIEKPNSVNDINGEGK